MAIVLQKAKFYFLYILLSSFFLLKNFLYSLQIS